MRDLTATSLIESLTSAEFARMNPNVRDSDRVELARFMARDANLPPEELEKVEDWAREMLARPSVQLTLTEGEWNRLRQRVCETFEGDRGAALGFSIEDRDLFHRLAIEVQRPSAEIRAEVDSWVDDGLLPLAASANDGFIAQIVGEAEQRAAGHRRECREAVREADYKLRDVLSEYGYSPEDPVLAEVVDCCRDAKRYVEAGLAALDRLDLRARGIDTEMLRRRVEENIALAQERAEQKRASRKQRSKDPLLQRMRMRRRAGKYGDVLPAEARAAGEAPPSKPENHARLRDIEAGARRLVSLMASRNSRAPTPGIGSALLALEREILERYDALNPFSGAYVELSEEQRVAAYELLSQIHRRAVPVTTADPWTLRSLLQWLTDQAVCFRCRRIGWACECL